MSKKAHQLLQLLEEGPKSVYELAEAMQSSPSGLKTLIFEMRTSGLLERANQVYPATYQPTKKAQEGPIEIEWKGSKRSVDWVRKSRAKKKEAAPGMVISAINNRPELQTVWR